jgi:hypothetical protein
MAREQKEVFNQDPWAPYNQIGEFVMNVLTADSEQFATERLHRKKTMANVIKNTWGSDTEVPSYLSPSTASFCIRAAVYEALGYKPVPRTPELALQARMGSSIHYSVMRALSFYGMSEREFILPTEHLKGRIDFVIPYHPLTKRTQILDFKCVGDFVFKLVTRKNLTPELMIDKKNYRALFEAERQLLIYMYSLSQEGFDVACGHLIYMSRNYGNLKRCIVPYTEKEKDFILNYIKQITDAHNYMVKGELPPPTVHSSNHCGKICHFIAYCEPGQHIAQGEIKRTKTPRVARAIIRKAQEETKAQAEKWRSRGIWQPELIPNELFDSGEESDLIETDITRTIFEATGGITLGRRGDIYNAIEETPHLPKENIIDPKDVITTKAKKEIFKRGDYELTGQTCECGQTLMRSVRLMKTLKNGRHKISVDDSCPSHGLVNHKEPTVGKTQLV